MKQATSVHDNDGQVGPCLYPYLLLSHVITNLPLQLECWPVLVVVGVTEHPVVPMILPQRALGVVNLILGVLVMTVPLKKSSVILDLFLL
jgi:hypothetical protein